MEMASAPRFAPASKLSQGAGECNSLYGAAALSDWLRMALPGNPGRTGAVLEQLKNKRRPQRADGSTMETVMSLNNPSLTGKALRTLIILPAILTLAGCISSSSPPPPERNTTVVVPPGSTVVCPNGAPSPC